MSKDRKIYNINQIKLRERARGVETNSNINRILLVLLMVHL